MREKLAPEAKLLLVPKQALCVCASISQTFRWTHWTDNIIRGLINHYKYSWEHIRIQLEWKLEKKASSKSNKFTKYFSLSTLCILRDKLQNKNVLFNYWKKTFHLGKEHTAQLGFKSMGIGHRYRFKSQIRSFRIIRIRGHGPEIRLGYRDLALKLHASKTLYRPIYCTSIN